MKRMGRISERRLVILTTFLIVFDILLSWVATWGERETYSYMIYFGFLFQIGTFSAWDLVSRRSLKTPIIFGASLAFMACIMSIPFVSKSAFGFSIGFVVALASTTIFKAVFFYYGFIRRDTFSSHKRNSFHVAKNRIREKDEVSATSPTMRLTWIVS